MVKKRIILVDLNEDLYVTRDKITGEFEDYEGGTEYSSSEVINATDNYIDTPQDYKNHFSENIVWKVFNNDLSNDSDIVLVAQKKDKEQVKYFDKVRNLWNRSSSNNKLRHYLIAVSVVILVLVINVVVGVVNLSQNQVVTDSDDAVNTNANKARDPTLGVFELGKEDQIQKGKELIKYKDSLSKNRLE